MLLVTAAGCEPLPANSLPDAAPDSWLQQIAKVQAGQQDEVTAGREPVDDSMLEQLSACGAQLTALSIDAGQISPAGLFRLKGLKNLHRLKLGCPVNNDHLEAIARLHQLRVLNLPHGEFNDHGVAALSALPHLELLRFHSPRVSDLGVQQFTGFPALRFLHLIDVPVTDAALGSIAKITQLESFYLDGGGCTEEGLSQLIKQRPDLHFHWNDLHLDDDPLRNSH